MGTTLDKQSRDRCGRREITDLDELKAIELGIMKVVHRFCEERGLRYFLAYGTLIGAMRHDGFIPWDDDIDIWMPREDYDRFLSEFPDYADRHGLFVATKNVGRFFPRNMIKVCDGTTELVEKGFKDDYKIGVFIDVWVLDCVPQNPLSKAVYLSRMKVLRSLFGCAVLDEQQLKSLRKKVFHHIGNAVGIVRILDRAERLCRAASAKESDTLFCWAVNMATYEMSDFEPRMLHKFENCEFYVPSGYDRILRKRFGNWMQFPPEDERIPHHIADIYKFDEKLPLDLSESTKSSAL